MDAKSTLRGAGVVEQKKELQPGGSASFFGPSRWLSLADNELGHPCGSLAADLFVQGQSSLKELSLAVNSISSGEIACFLRTLAKLSVSEDLYIDLAQTAAQPQALPIAAKAIARCPGLVINLKGCQALAPEHLEAHLDKLPPGRLLI